MVLLILTINGKQAQGGEVIWLRLHRNQKENEHQHLTHTKSVRNACCPSAELMQRLLCASKGFQQLASVGNSGPGHVPPKSHLPRLSGASKRICNPGAPARAALSLHRPRSAQPWLQESQRQSSCSFGFFFSAGSHTDVHTFCHSSSPNHASLVNKGLGLVKKILNLMGHISLPLVFARGGSVNRSRGTEIPLLMLSRRLLKQTQAPR